MHTAVWARASLFRQFTDTNVYTEAGGSVGIRKTRMHHEIFVDTRMFLVLRIQCRSQKGDESATGIHNFSSEKYR